MLGEGAIGVGPRLQPLVLEFLRDRREVLLAQHDRFFHRTFVRPLRVAVELQRLRAVLTGPGRPCVRSYASAHRDSSPSDPPEHHPPQGSRTAAWGHPGPSGRAGAQRRTA